MDSGKATVAMAMGCRPGRMELGIRVSGRTTKLTAKVSLFTSMEIFTRGSGNKIRLMASEFIYTPTEHCMRATGETTIRTDMV